MGWNQSMMVSWGDDPADELLRVSEALGLFAGEPLFTTVGDAMRRDFEGIGIGTFGPFVLLVAPSMAWRANEPALVGCTHALVFHASENMGGTNIVHVHAHGRQVAAWEEAGERDIPHPLLADLPDELHPFDRVQQVAERVLGVRPLELLEVPLFWLPDT